ncbi:MAG: class I SAM-dependent methyltransferase [Calothrix sp. C42_A2020_038]|nr:class I SAM-dependent methyltransferase [Calothrix sp. C42_A2020_038]
MTIFSNYARYYDLIYRDKDYAGEAEFIHRLIQSHAPNTKSILELGCGQGKHAILLAHHGYHIHGVDLSQEMLQKADNHLSSLNHDLASQLKFSHGDIRQVRLNQTFDVILSLFHVISYQTTNEDLLAAFATVKEHLNPGGIFIFDIWYGPTVLTEHPTTRVKRIEDENIQVTRIAEPVIHSNENLVDVNYQVFIKDKTSGTVEELQETHRMRYLFQPEIEFLCSANGLASIESREWMTGNQPGLNTWGVYFIMQN